LNNINPILINKMFSLSKYILHMKISHYLTVILLFSFFTISNAQNLDAKLNSMLNKKNEKKQSFIVNSNSKITSDIYDFNGFYRTMEITKNLKDTVTIYYAKNQKKPNLPPFVKVVGQNYYISKDPEIITNSLGPWYFQWVDSVSFLLVGIHADSVAWAYYNKDKKVSAKLEAEKFIPADVKVLSALVLKIHKDKLAIVEARNKKILYDGIFTKTNIARKDPAFEAAIKVWWADNYPDVPLKKIIIDQTAWSIIKDEYDVIDRKTKRVFLIGENKDRSCFIFCGYGGFSYMGSGTYDTACKLWYTQADYPNNDYGVTFYKKTENEYTIHTGKNYPIDCLK
jgi:hypothetical protein